jgi:hypothetical protein
MNIDFSSSYNINHTFNVWLEALNLTDEVQDQWVGSEANRLSATTTRAPSITWERASSTS